MLNKTIPSLLWALSWFLIASRRTVADSPNHLLHRKPSTLKNDYYVLRHGQSEANVAKVIASSPITATKKYGLSEAGKEQAALAGQEVIAAFKEHPQKRVLLLTSDLLRAKETAEIVRGKLLDAGIPMYNVEDGLIIETRFRERWFGEWEATSDDNYPNVWKDDATNPDHTLKGVESVNQVMERTTKCITEWDDQLQECFVICVAHGDVLQILQTAFCKMDGSQHRTLEHLETARLRKMELKE